MDLDAPTLGLPAAPTPTMSLGARGFAAGAVSFVRSEVGIFVAGVTVIALHVLDTNFIRPQSGTAAGDHLVSGLVPLTLMLAAAAVFGRLGAGPRGALALTFGFLGLAFGGYPSTYHALTDGPSGTDWTGIAATAVGVSLIAAGSGTLWRSRRLDDRKRVRYPRRLLIAFAAVVVGVQVLGAIAFSYAVTHPVRHAPPTANLGAPYENVTFTTSDGLDLVGWYVPSKNGAAVITFPGRRGPQAHARMLIRHGYGVLLFDRRGEGESEGDANPFGWGGERDIYAAIEFLAQRPEVDPRRIGGIGFSVGGELMLQAAAQRGGLAAVVSEGAGARSLAEDMQDIPSPSKYVGFAFLSAKEGAIATFTNTAPPPRLTDLVPRIAPTPLLLIWAPTGGENLNKDFYRVAGRPKQIWEIPESAHTKGIVARPAEYERRVVGFFDQALLA